MTRSDEQLRETVRKKYAEVARSADSGCCGVTACCDDESLLTDEITMIGDAYDGVGGYMQEADLGLGCGLPVEHAGLRHGQTVLDLGSGAGLDIFVAREHVGESGRLIGVDMTAEMISKARRNARKAGFENIEFRLGEIENMPVRSGEADVVISNCVLNLVPDKQQAFAEIYRVLKKGGHFCISDVVSSRRMPDWAREIADAYAGCVSGTMPKIEYLDLIRKAGFEQVTVVTERRIDVPEDLLAAQLSSAQKDEVQEQDLHLSTVTVTARKP